MALEIKIPAVGESVTEVEIGQWVVEDGDYVERDDTLCEIESEKATLEVTAEESGKVKILKQEGDVAQVGEVIAEIDTSVKGEKKKEKPAVKEEKKAVEKKPEETKPVEKKEEKAAAKATPLAKEMMEKHKVEAALVKGTGQGGKIIREDVAGYLAGGFDKGAVSGWGGTREENRKKMSMLRRKVAQRLVSVKNETAMLTTFNEVDMSAVMNLRKKHKETFKEKFGVGLGFMSFFTKAITESLGRFPDVNAMIDGEEIIYHSYADVGIAVSTPKGLMVPVLRNAEQMSLAELEANIKDLAIKARDGKISMEEMTGGTFTITNGGVFGSMLSTPIINPPQSAILGMHNIVERPVAVDGKVEIRPVMYIALSYDHRIIDGRESVTFLKTVKELLENPIHLMFTKDPEEVLLGL